MRIFKLCRKRAKSILVTLILVFGQAFGAGPAIAAAEITVDYQFVDTFSSGSLSGYTQFSDYPAQWSVDTLTRSLTATGGRQSKLVVGGYNAQNVELEAQLTSAVDGGLVARVQDNDNYYLLAIRDGSKYPANLEIAKRVEGSYTSLGITSISWPEGTKPTIKFVVRGSKLEAYLNGQQVLSLEDNSISTAGSVGLRQCTVLDGGYDAVVYNEFKVRNLDLAVAETPAPAQTETDLDGQLQMPLRPDGSNIFQQGRVIPVKFHLVREDGSPAADVTPRLYLIPGGADAFEEASLLMEAAGELVSFDLSSGHYHFNLSTKETPAGEWRLLIKAGGNTVMEVGFSLK